MINNNPMILFDVAHNSEGFKSFLNYYQTLKINGNSILIIALYSKKNIQDIVPNIESCFDHIICTETKGRSPMCAKNLYNHFNPNHSVEIISNPSLAIKKGLDMINSNGGMAILGTHCLGPYIN